jgi:hypothetical protein
VESHRLLRSSKNKSELLRKQWGTRCLERETKTGRLAGPPARAPPVYNINGNVIFRIRDIVPAFQLAALIIHPLVKVLIISFISANRSSGNSSSSLRHRSLIFYRRSSEIRIDVKLSQSCGPSEPRTWFSKKSATCWAVLFIFISPRNGYALTQVITIFCSGSADSCAE